MTDFNRRAFLNSGLIIPTHLLTGTAVAEEIKPASKVFSFCVLGDTCYDFRRDYKTYLALIDKINTYSPAFTIHVGDTKGAGLCNEAFHRRVYDDFNKFEHPLIYTPGDNEWVDAYLDVNENGDPLASLALIRKIFFSESRSLGRLRMPLVRQADVNDHKLMVENAIWQKSGVVFGTLHIPGTNNGYSVDGVNKSPEFDGRHEANLDWLKTIFATAKARNAPAIVIGFHADWFRELDDEPNAFEEIDRLLREESLRYGKPVLLVHGDLHIFTIDRPYHLKGKGGSWGAGYNVIRLQPHGAPELKAVLVTVDLTSPDPFAFKTISVPQIHRTSG